METHKVSLEDLVAFGELYYDREWEVVAYVDCYTLLVKVSGKLNERGVEWTTKKTY